MSVDIEKQGYVWTVVIDRPEKKNAVDRDTADSLARAFRDFNQDETARAAVLWGKGGTFCAGADLKALAGESEDMSNRLEPDMQKDGPMGPSRMQVEKPVIAAVSGYAVAGGLELACWCDIRVVEETAVFGVFCRRFGVPLIDGGTQRLPLIVGLGRALDLILTGREVHPGEALEIGLANYVVKEGKAREKAESLAETISAFPQLCLRSDRRSVYQGLNSTFEHGMAQEFKLGAQVIQSGESVQGAREFMGGKR